MFNKILVANRGEIACRIIKTARKMGIKTVAVYSDVDRDGLHVRMADEAVHIGGAAASSSYLLADKIVEACQLTGAEAVHPGYGFLSERPGFEETLKKAGISFIGPNSRAIEAMGDKIASKKLAAEAGVSTVPGFLGVIPDTEEAVRIAEGIGYPVMMKASAGGGGKGMRVAWNEQEVRDGFSAAMNEARSSFGDDRVFIEKFITTPRHIEIQVLGDKFGNIIHLCERECSIQRRHQKVIEEAPSPFLDEQTRAAMGEQAIALARAVDYDSAGTVEFIVDSERNFYFLEMNTRLQVEHPVTELITGVDLVEQMIRVAAGEKLSLTQSDVQIDGWAMESRIYAEDPMRNFLPSIGRVVRYQTPEEVSQKNGCTVRVDTGIYEGGDVSIYYDPMIAKLCTHASTRDEAIKMMLDALNQTEVQGLGHNIVFLAAMMRDKNFQSGDISTNFIAETYPEGFKPRSTSAEDREFLALFAAGLHVREEQRLTDETKHGSHHTFSQDKTLCAIFGPVGQIQHMHEMRVSQITENEILIRLMGENIMEEVKVSMLSPRRDPVQRFLVNGKPMAARISTNKLGYNISWSGCVEDIMVLSPRAAELLRFMPHKMPPDTSKLLQCPMPGLLVSVAVSVGDEVQPGQPLAVVEAMKMENILRAERKGVVQSINADVGASLSVDQVIMEFE